MTLDFSKKIRKTFVCGKRQSLFIVGGGHICLPFGTQSIKDGYSNVASRNYQKLAFYPFIPSKKVFKMQLIGKGHGVQLTKKRIYVRVAKIFTDQEVPLIVPKFSIPSTHFQLKNLRRDFSKRNVFKITTLWSISIRFLSAKSKLVISMGNKGVVKLTKPRTKQGFFDRSSFTI